MISILKYGWINKMDTGKKKIIEWIEIARGIGILLVVFGHAIADIVPDNKIFHAIFVFIYSFHMPLFFFISGYVGANALEQYKLSDKIQFWKRRFKRLIIPYFSIGIIYIPIKIILAKYATNSITLSNVVIDILIGNNPNAQLWTLYALFIESIVITLFAKKDGGYHRNSLFCFSLLLAILSTQIPTSVIKQTMFELFFYAIGSICRKEKVFDKQLNIIITPFALAALILINYITTIDGDNPLKILTGVLGCLCIFVLCINLSNANIRLMKLVGMYSMDIYVLANFVQVFIRIMSNKIPQVSEYIYLLMSFLLGIIIPICLSKYIIRKSNVLSILILGKRRDK